MSGNTGKLNANGCTSITGTVVVKAADGSVLFEGDKTWLCRCGKSGKKPFCDGSHKQGFAHDGTARPVTPVEIADGSLTITALDKGPLQVEGPLTLRGADGATIYCGTETWLCRCGHSSNKPFCDGTHNKIGFTG